MGNHPLTTVLSIVGKASFSGDCSFFMRKMVIKGLGLDSTIYYKCFKDTLHSVSKRSGWMVQVVPYLIFAHSKEVLNFYEKLGTKVTEWSEIFGRFKGPYVISWMFSGEYGRTK